ncbi:MAG: DMT family transporter [Thermomicrobiaceae bacterium]|nr:DMT family transporter [Thermomicrobiaceae bacterium]
MDRRGQAVGIAFVLGSTLGFGLTPTLTRLAFDAGVNVPTALAIRFTSAALLGWPFLLWRRQALLPPRRLIALLLVGLCFVANTSCFFLAIAHAPASTVAVIFYAYPAVVTLLSALFLGERIGPVRALALALALLGCLLTLGFDLSGVRSEGALLAALSALFYAAYILLSSRVARGLPVGLASTWIMTSMAAAFLAFGLATGSLDVGFQPRGWLVLAAMVLGATVLAVQLFLAGVLRLGPARAAIVGSVEPVIAVALTALVLGERLGPMQALGGLSVLAAVLLLRLPSAEVAMATEAEARERPAGA